MKVIGSGSRGVLFIGLGMLILCTGCAANLQTRISECGDSIAARPLDANSARVCVSRQSSMLGAIVTHYVVDSGSNAVYNAKIIRKNDVRIKIVAPLLASVEILPDDPMFANRGVMGSVIYLVLPEPGIESRPNWVMRNRNDKIIWIVDKEQIGAKLIKVTSYDITSKVDSLTDNCRYVGSVGNGEYVVYDRPSGIMRLRVITPNGDESFAPDFNIKAGKRYFVDYQYTSQQFIVSERP
jgi:hypothetical protein